MTNELLVGERRTGSIIDFDETTPEVQGTLERSEDRTVLTVPWPDFESPYASWFGHGPNKVTKIGAHDKVVLPKVLLFEDAHGPVLLVGCRNIGYHTSIFGPGTGRISVEYAVLGVRDNCDFSQPTGAESEVSGLREWLGISGVERTLELEDRIHRDTLVVSAAETISVGGPFNLEFRSAPQVVPPGTRGEWRVRDLVYCATTSSTAVDIHDLRAHHHAVRDLLVVSCWWPETCILRRATHPQAPLRTLDGKEHGAQWCDVVVARDKPQEPPSALRNDLIRFEEIGAIGVMRWIELRDEFARALDPVISTVDLEATLPSTYLAQAGPGLEALGYMLKLRDGLSKKKADEVRLQARLERILDDVGDSAPIDIANWASTTSDAYNGLKHINRRPPAVLDALNSWRESVLVVRAWVALELGVPAKDVKERLRRDPQAQPYTPA